MPPGAEGYEFGPYRIDEGERLLRREGELIPLPPKVVNTLLALVRSAGRAVDKGDLIKEVWPDTFVEEGALTRNISLLRKTFGDTGDEAAYIETIPKRGYRFVAPVRMAGGQGPGAGEQAPGTGDRGLPAARKWVLVTGILLVLGVLVVAKIVIRHHQTGPAGASRILAVLPFRNLESDGSRDYFADGVTEALIARLANVRSLRVVSLAADAGPQSDQAGWSVIRQNGQVNGVLTGAVSRYGGRLRIDAKLMDPGTRMVRWAKSYEHDAGDLLALESTVAEAIAGEIQVTLTAEDRARLRQQRRAKPEAVDAYLRGRYFWNRRTEDGLRRAAAYFQQAIAADPAYAPAYAGLADSYALLGSIGTDAMPPREAMPLAKAAAEKAVELDPSLAEGRVSLGYVKLSYDWDLSGAAREFSRALELNPGSATARHWYSHYFMAAGNLDQALEQMREALQLEPLSPSINVGVGWCLYYSRQYDRAIEQFRSVTEIDPTLPLAHQTLGMAYEQKGLHERAIEEYNRAATFSNNSPSAVAALAGAYAGGGKTAEARRELSRLEEMSRARYVPAFYFASVHYAMGDVNKTLDWIRKSVAERCDYLVYMRVEPRAEKLAREPEFGRIMKALHP